MGRLSWQFERFELESAANLTADMRKLEDIVLPCSDEREITLHSLRENFLEAPIHQLLLRHDISVSNNLRYEYRMSLSYFHENDICSSTIDNYKGSHVPMVWGYWKHTKIKIADEATDILGFNEPNHKEESKLTPKKAAAAWPDMERNSKGKPLVSPSAAKCGSKCISTEIEWFDEFFKLCKGCRVDYLATHSYVCNANKVMTYLKQLFERYGRKIWLTEFACSKTSNCTKQLNFMKQILPMLEDADFIYRYAWYTARLTKSGFVTTAASLLEPNSSALTPLGRYYNEFQGLSNKHLPAKPSEEEIKSIDTDPSKVRREETLLILKSYPSNPTSWGKILRYLRENVDELPESVRNLYYSLSDKQLKQRVKKKFKEVLCTDLENIQDEDIRDMVEVIRNMAEERANGRRKKKNDGKLRVPRCSKA